MKIRGLLLIILFFIFTSCTKQNNQSDKLLIAVSIPPQAWFVSQIAGEKADVLILVPPGQNPHNYEPTPRQIQALSKAKAWILSGTEFEITLQPKIKALFPNLLIIDGTHGVKYRYMEDHNHDCGNIECNESSDSFFDRHTWLGREPALLMAKHINETFFYLDYDNAEYYDNRYLKIINEINSVFEELQIDLAPLSGKSVFVYHPSFGYFLDNFNIIQEAVEMEGKEPTPRQLNDLMEKIKEQRPAAIFVQTQFPVNAARTLAQSAEAQVIELDPLAQDWLENIKHMGQALKNIIQ